MQILKTLRIERKKSQQQIAELLGITQQSYGRYELDKIDPPKDILIKLAKYYDVTTDYLLGIDSGIKINNGIIGNQNRNNTITIGGAAARQLTEFETQLLEIYNALDTKKKTELLTYAFGLKDKE